MGCGEFFVKYILFFANLFFALAGLTLIGLGIAVQLQVTEITELFQGAYQIAPIITIVIGFIIFFIAFFGCCGAIRESNCMLVTYAIFMIILMIIKLSLAVVIFVNLQQFTDQIAIWMNEAFQRPDPQPFYAVQNIFKCCGTTGPTSYGIAITLPGTCCDSKLTLSACTIVEAYQKGCTTALTDFFDVFGTVVGAIAIAVVAIELVAVVFSLCLANHSRNKERRMRY